MKKKIKDGEKFDGPCVWDMGTPCGGEVLYKELIDHQIGVPICADHLAQHIEMMTLNQNGYDIHQLTAASPEWRHEVYLKLIDSGVKPANP